MYIRKVLSYGKAWDSLCSNHANKLDEITSALRGLTAEEIEALGPMRDLPYWDQRGVTPIRMRQCWDNLMLVAGWEASVSAIRNPGSRPISLRALGHIRDGISVSLLRQAELLNRWLFTVAPIAVRNGLVDIPIALLLLEDTASSLFGRRSIPMANFARTRAELNLMQPLSHRSPFLILGISADHGPFEVTELEGESVIQLRQVVINRAIEFPPEYHQAGLGILGYFGTVLRERYPQGDAVVKIEQDGLTVRLIVESENGDRETIEKALHEYELVVRGESPPEILFESRAKVIELKNELRIAQVRIESQRDLIEYQGQEIAAFRQLFDRALSLPSGQSVNVTVSPAINVTASSSSNLSPLGEIPFLSECLQELLAVASKDPGMAARLLDLDESINAVASRQSQEQVRNSGGMNKLRKFLDEAIQAGSTVNKLFIGLGDGLGSLQKILKAYNNIAIWCGMPEVPIIFPDEVQ